jgi:hypothetical protein
MGFNTPEACVGSNDLGLGRLVEAATHSRFWKEMAIFVIEDDAQDGPDHVDSHRTVGLVISPWCRRHFIDSTLYTTASMVRTMELILGLPPLTQYDAGATPMFNCFQRRETVIHYARSAHQALYRQWRSLYQRPYAHRLRPFGHTVIARQALPRLVERKGLRQ